MTDFPAARPGAMEHLEPVRFDLEESLVARQFLSGHAIRRQRQPRAGVSLDLLQERWHQRNLGTSGGERKRATG